MKQLRGRTAVITGAAAGIGRATALALAREHMNVVLADLNEAGLAAVQAEVESLGRRAWTVATDVTEARAVQDLHDRSLSLAGHVHVVMNNAGIARFGPALELSDEDWKQVLDVNLWGVIHGCRIFGPTLVAQGEGHIVNTASVAGLSGLPTCASYVASKFAVVGLSEVLRFELGASGVGVTALCPGFVKTSIANLEGSEKLAEVVRKYGGDPDALARRIVRAIRKNEAQVLFGPEPLLMTGLRRFSRRLYDRGGRMLGAAMVKEARATANGN